MDNVPTMPSRRLIRMGGVLTALGLALLAAVYVRALWFTPIERYQGAAQKIFYVHVPAAWVSLVTFVVAGALSVLLLRRDRPRLELAAAAAAEVGVVLAGIVLVTGPLWGRPVWGRWWAWDLRLITMLALFGLFAGYLLLRRLLADPVLRREMCAVVGIGGLLLVPITHFAVALARTQHPDPVVLRADGPALPGSMLSTLFLGVFAFAVLGTGYVIQRYVVYLSSRADSN